MFLINFTCREVDKLLKHLNEIKISIFLTILQYLLVHDKGKIAWLKKHLSNGISTCYLNKSTVSHCALWQVIWLTFLFLPMEKKMDCAKEILFKFYIKIGKKLTYLVSYLLRVFNDYFWIIRRVRGFMKMNKNIHSTNSCSWTQLEHDRKLSLRNRNFRTSSFIFWSWNSLLIFGV